MMTETQDKPEVFLERSFGFRNWRDCVAGLILLSMGGAELAFLAVMGNSFLQTHSPIMWANTAALAMFCIFMICVGSLWLVWVLRNRQVRIRIDTDGVMVRSRRWRWQEIKWIGAKWFWVASILRLGIGRRRYFVSFLPQRKWFERMIPTRPLLTEDECAALLSRLGQYLAKHYPDVALRPARGDRKPQQKGHRCNDT